jgi:hypothetical protein
MRSTSDAQKFGPISATTAAFPLFGGLYQFNVVATFGGGSVTFQQLGPDGLTWLTVSPAIVANGGGTFYVPPGNFRIAIVTATAVYADVCRVPFD